MCSPITSPLGEVFSGPGGAEGTFSVELPSGPPGAVRMSLEVREETPVTAHPAQLAAAAAVPGDWAEDVTSFSGGAGGGGDGWMEKQLGSEFKTMPKVPLYVRSNGSGSLQLHKFMSVQIIITISSKNFRHILNVQMQFTFTVEAEQNICQGIFHKNLSSMSSIVNGVHRHWTCCILYAVLYITTVIHSISKQISHLGNTKH